MAVEEQVAHRTAADRGDGGQHEHADQVQAPTSGRERPADGEDRNTDEIEDVEVHAGEVTGRGVGSQSVRPGPSTGRFS